MKAVQFASMAVGAAILAGCAATPVQQINSATATGDAFTERLAREYRDIANFEFNRMHDYRDANRIAQKGLAAASGEAIGPYEVSAFDLPADSVAELTEARATLVSTLDGNARINHPEYAAIAQSRFDCWIEQQEEGHQADHIAACRDEFYWALAQMQGAPLAEEVYFIFFDWDRSNITADAQTTLSELVAAWSAEGQPTISVVGHTDTSGPRAYNQGLSERRAASTQAALTALGVPATQVVTSGRGEDALLVPTPDGVREPSNRRAEISFR